jgi:hypothetical protein
MSKIIGIIGTRQRNTKEDFALVEEAFLRVYEKGDTICSGLSPQGGDRFAVILAEKYNTPTLWFPAKWGKYGRSAGFKRNIDIAKNSDILIACVAKDRKGGTEDTIKKWRINHSEYSEGIILV